MPDLNDHTFIGTRLSDPPLVLDQAEANLNSLCATRRTASQRDPAKPAKSLPLPYRHPRRELFEVRVEADEHGAIHFTYRRHKGIGGVRRNPLAQQNDLKTGITKNGTDRIRHTMIDEKSYRE